MKRMIALLTVTAMLLCFAACADKTPTNSDTDKTTTVPAGSTTLAPDGSVTTTAPSASGDTVGGTTASGEEGAVTTDGGETTGDGVSSTTDGDENGSTTTQGEGLPSGSTTTQGEGLPGGSTTNRTDSTTSPTGTTDSKETTSKPSTSGDNKTTGTTASGSSGGKTTTTMTDGSSSTTAKPTDPPAQEPMGPTQSTAPTTTTTQVVIDVDKTFTPTTIMDNAHARVTIIGIEEDAADGYTLLARFENRSAKTNCQFMVNTATVNGILTEPLYATEVGVGETVEDRIVFFNVVPEGVDIGEYTDIMLELTVSDADNWMAGALAQVSAHIYPQGKDKASTYRHTAAAGEQVLIDNAYITAIAVTTAEDARLGRYYSYIYFLNKTAEPLMFSLDAASINNIGVNPRYGTYLSPETATFGRVVWLNNTLANSHIQKVERISFDLTVVKELDWENVEEEEIDKAILVSEKVTFVP